MLAENTCLTSSCFHKVFAGIVQVRRQGGAMGVNSPPEKSQR